MFGTGVASFGHVGGVHLQNVDRWEEYIAALDRDELPLGRALSITPHQALIREMILQLKTGHVNRAYFQRKFGVDVRDEFADGWRRLEEDDKVLVMVSDDECKLKSVIDILQGKLVKRGVPVKNLSYGKVEPALSGTVRQRLTLQQGIPTEA